MFMAACANAEASPKASTEAQAISVTTAEVIARAVPRHITLVGSLVADRESEVAAAGSGKVVETRVERGDHVQQGAILVRLDSRAAALGRAEASAQAATAEVQKRNAKLECDRAERLYAERVISTAERDRMRAGCESAVFSTKAADARRLLADKTLGDSVVRAPFAGLVVERGVTVGEFVVPGRRVATLVDIDPLRVELTVPEFATLAVSEGKRVQFSVAALPGRRFSAEIRFVGPVLRRSSRDLVVEAVIDNAGHELRPGMFVTARLQIGQETLPTIVAQALVARNGSERVFVVRDGRIEERIVRSGERDGVEVAIVAGLGAGERVVVGPPPGLRDGVSVK